MKTLSSLNGSEKIFESIEDLFAKNELFLTLNQHFSFICGAGSQQENSIRNQFLDFLNQYNTIEDGILPILAEKATDEFLSSGEAGHAKPDLGQFENLIAECVDSIVIFPESAGSLAELGFFAANINIRKKTIVAINEEHQGSSFINLGIIPIYNQHSAFTPSFVISDNRARGFENIVERLETIVKKRSRRTRFVFDQFHSLSEKEKLITLYELVRLLGYVSKKNLYEVIGKVFKKYDLDNVKRLLAILVAFNYVNRSENDDYFIKKNAPTLLDYSGDSFDQTKAKLLAFYQKHDEQALQMIESST